MGTASAWSRRVGVAALAVIVAALVLAGTGTPRATAADLPGICQGVTDAGLVVVAHANGRPGPVPKFILNVATDAGGQASGTLVLGRGADRLEVTEWCRMWQHQPGQVPGGECEAPSPEPEPTMAAHAVGLATIDGTGVVVRADVRTTADGTSSFRVRYRAMGEHEEGTSEHDETGCDGGGWSRVPVTGWYELDRLAVRSA